MVQQGIGTANFSLNSSLSKKDTPSFIFFDCFLEIFVPWQVVVSKVVLKL